jgi:hypothetical protein
MLHRTKNNNRPAPIFEDRHTDRRVCHDLLAGQSPFDKGSYLTRSAPGDRDRAFQKRKGQLPVGIYSEVAGEFRTIGDGYFEQVVSPETVGWEDDPCRSR